MRDSSTIMRERQCAVRRELDRRQIPLKVIALDSEIPYPTLLSYFPACDGARQPAEMPIGVLFRLCGHIPTDLLNLLMPEGFAIVAVPNGLDFDEIDRACREFCAAKAAAHHPESEAGRDIGPGEAEALARVVPIRSAA